MTEDDQPRVLAVTTLIGIQLIDGGDTAAIRFRGADGDDVGMLIPRETACVLAAHLSEVLARPHRRDHREG